MKNTSSHSEKRNMGVTVLAGVVMLMSYILAFTFLPLNTADVNSIIYFSVAVGVGTIALVVAIYGRKSALKQFVESLIDFSV